MSISPRMLKKLLGKLGEIASRVRELEQTMQSVRQRQEAYDAKSDAVVVPPGSTLFQPGEVRLFEITGEVAAAKVDATLLALDSEGDMEDDPGDDETYSLRVPREDMTLETGDMVAATFEGVDGGAGVYVINSGPAPRLTPFRVTAVNEVGGNRQTWTAKRLAPSKEPSYNNWPDHPTDDTDYTLRAIDEYGNRGSGPWKEWDLVYAMPQAVTGADPEWFIVGGLGDAVPEGEGQYKVLQLDGQDQPHWDYVRAYE